MNKKELRKKIESKPMIPSEIFKSEENKYYTPNIEEFYVGFEYEYSTGANKWKHSKCVKSDFRELQWHIDNGFRRVKYLDKEDIESLGFSSTDPKSNYYSSIVGHSSMSMFSRDDWDNTRWCIRDDTFDIILFLGEIKNKSELKKVLKMIGIYD